MEDVDAAEQLYLLEILIEKITFRKATLMKYYQTKDDALLPLMVSVRFCGLPLFEISQETIRSPNSLDFGKVGEFNCGESCLFSMDTATLTRNIKRSPLQMTVVRKQFTKKPPDFLGTAQATLPETMIEAVANAPRSQELPLSCAYEDTVNIRTEDNEDAGFLTLFVRLSCFGQSIITQFKLMKETKSFLFKSAKADAPYICDSLDMGEFPLDDPTKVPQSAPGEMLAFGDFKMSVHRSSIQKPLYGLCSGDATINTSSDIISILKSFKIRIHHDFILQNYLNCPMSKFCSQTVGKNININVSGFVTVISPNKAPVLSTEHLRGGGCKGEESCGGCKNVSFCGTGGNSGAQQAGPCSTSTSIQRVCCCDSCTNSKDVTPPRYLASGRSIQDVVPVTPIICTQDELIDPDMEQQLDSGAVKTRAQEWQELFCFCMGGTASEDLEKKAEEPPKIVYKTTNPPIRYDTTGALTAAAEGVRPVPLGDVVVNASPLEPNPPIRYNTTSALTRCQEITPEGDYIEANPPVRYDTTGALTAASGGRRPVPLDHFVIPANPDAHNPPIRYNTTSILTSDKYKPPAEVYRTANPPIRYDTTGALTCASEGRRPVPKGCLVVSENPDAPNPPVRYNTTGALSPAYKPPTEAQLRQRMRREREGLEEGEEAEGEEEEEEAVEEESFVSVIEEKDFGDIDASLEKLFPQYFVPDKFLDQELELAIRKTRSRKRGKKPKKAPKGRPFLPPGVLLGHRHCVEWEPRVPKTQGWLWNGIDGILGLPFRDGWRPGAVRRSVALMFYNIDKRHKKKRLKIEVKDKPLIPPTLHIAKKKGIYYITMRPMDMPPDDPTPPITFRLPPLAEGETDEWFEENASSGSSDLEIEFCAPGTCPPDFPPKDICIQCSLSQGLLTSVSSASAK